MYVPALCLYFFSYLLLLCEKASDDVSKNLQQIKSILVGDGGACNNLVAITPSGPSSSSNSDTRVHMLDPLPELIAQLAQETYSTDLLYHLLQNIQRLDFESRKDVVQIFNTLLRRQIGSRFPTVEYLSNKPEVLFTAFRGYEHEEVALNTGMILKEMLRHEPLAKLLLHSEEYVIAYTHSY